MNDEIQANSKELLGGDIQISSGIDPLSSNTIEVLSQLGQVSERVELGTMLTKQNDTASLHTKSATGIAFILDHWDFPNCGICPYETNSNHPNQS